MIINLPVRCGKGATEQILIDAGNRIILRIRLCDDEAINNITKSILTEIGDALNSQKRGRTGTELDARLGDLENTIDSIAIHTLHLLWLVDSENHSELKKYFDAGPRGLLAHVAEIQKHCAEVGSSIAQTGKIPEENPCSTK